MKITEILKNVRQQTGDNAKIMVLEQNKSDEMLQRIIQLAYDTNRFQFGISYKAIHKLLQSGVGTVQTSFEEVIKFMENGLGNKMRTADGKLHFAQMVNSLSDEYKELVLNIIDRNLKIGLNLASLVKIFDFVYDMKYMRCGILDEKTIKNIKFPAMLQVKMDGTYRQIDVTDDVVIRSRQGQVDFNPVLRAIFLRAPKGSYIGELTIHGVPRSESNGLINSNNPPYDNIVFTAWDFIAPNSDETYEIRYKQLCENLPRTRNTNLVLTRIVKNPIEVKNIVTSWMQEGLEGGVLKDFSNLYRNGTSKTQLKVKKVIDADVRIVGFKEGALNSTRAGKIGSLRYETDDHQLQGYVSGFNETFLNEVTANPDNFLGKIMVVRFNDIHKSRNGTYSLQLPRFVELRTDKTTTDDLSRIIAMVGMSETL